MTLQQLKYVITVAETGTITEAANRLYVSQPSLTNAIHELEKEMNIVIFNRTNKGITLSKEGDDFLGYARQVLEQAAEGGGFQFEALLFGHGGFSRGRWGRSIIRAVAAADNAGRPRAFSDGRRG
jgi:DNA-binding transcriptional LysR family regulator